MDKQIQVLETQSVDYKDHAEELVISNGETMSEAVDLLSKLNQFSDRVAEESDKVVKPLKEALKAEEGRWKPIMAPIKDAIAVLRTKIGTYQTIEARRVKEEEAAIAARVGDGKGKIKVETAVKKMGEIEKPEAKVVAGAGMVKFRTDKKLLVKDEQLIPREYLVVDEKKVLEALKAGTVVPGAEIELVQTPINFR